MKLQIERQRDYMKDKNKHNLKFFEFLKRISPTIVQKNFWYLNFVVLLTQFYFFLKIHSFFLKKI